MNTHQKTKTHEAAAGKPSKTKDTNSDASESAEMLRQAVVMLNPLIEFHKADANMTVDDVKMYWDVRLVRGQDEPFAHLQSSSTFHKMLSSNMQALASSRIQDEIRDKILSPLVAMFQAEVTRVALEDLAAEREAARADGVTEEDGFPCWGGTGKAMNC